uniref:Ig-like domain-containing protein n=1 Tax=Stegastes partitus TaxID=144197 RepID=A0A3B4ZUF7_9TELE
MEFSDKHKQQSDVYYQISRRSFPTKTGDINLFHHLNWLCYHSNYEIRLPLCVPGAHILQRMNGCEWDDETGDIRGFNQYGYDGEDFIALDLQTLTWIAPKPQAFITKLRWDTEKARLQFNKNYLIHECPDWLKTYVDYGRSFLQRTDLPSVSLLQKTASSPVTCHATGFCPDRADLFWTKDGEELHEDMDKGELLPNHDGSFQMSVDLKVSSIAPEDWRRYNCVFHLSGLLSFLPCWTFSVSPSEFPAGPFLGGVVGLLLLPVVFIAGLFIRRRSSFCARR